MNRRTKTSKWLAVILAVVLMLSTVPFTIVYAANVSTQNQLKTAIQNNQDINLTSNITLDSWSSLNYSGNLNGNGYVIYTPNALFNQLSGSVTDLGVLTSIPTFSDTAVLAKNVTATGAVEGCFAYGTIQNTSTGTVIGGLIASLNGGTVTESFALIDITANSMSHTGYVGGLIGRISSGTVTDCYSAGAISVDGSEYNLCKIAGLANIEVGVASSAYTVGSTYTSCQLRQPNSRAKASGVNGYYDNQLSIVRESYQNLGLSTRELMSTEISDRFAVTGTTYPMLKCFHDNKWCDAADSVIRVSTAAVAFADVDSTVRVEPNGFAARADYLTLNTYADRTNGFDLSWVLNSQAAKVLDTVPVTSTNVNTKTEAGTMSDLLRSVFQFAAADSSATLTATSGDAQRVWYLNAATQNPYFYKSTGNNKGTASGNPFWIRNIEQLNVVRHYACVGSYHYKLSANISCSDFDPIVNFRGNFNGNSKQLSNLKLTNADGLTAVGLFANTLSGTTVRYLTLHNATVTAVSGTSPLMGSLIGSAASSSVYRNIVQGANTTLTNTATTGGLIGKAASSTVRDNLVSATITGGDHCGGIVGEMSGTNKLYKCGSTGVLIGKTNLGGLIGKTTSTPVENSYSTMAVLTQSTGAVNIGGLIGNNGGTLKTSYAASLVYAKNGTSAIGPLVGAGAAGTNCYFEGNGSLETENMVGTSVMSSLTVTPSDSITSDTNGESWLWTKTDGYMPQITYFARTTRYQTLSKISTTPVYFQKYWEERLAENMTTGWITNSSATVQYEKPATGIEGYHDGKVTVYSVNSGWGFEAESSSACVAYVFKQSSGLGIRAAGALRPAMYSLRYSVQGTPNTHVYVELGFSSAKDGEYSSSQTKINLNSTNAQVGKVLYDMPASQFVRVKVITKDEYKVLFNAVTLQDGT
ncbi:MAG: hypothetical protein IJD01_07315, partial [Clostridia bacterium]|nr:hypothetical protein [Clostridia bacterium]